MLYFPNANPYIGTHNDGVCIDALTCTSIHTHDVQIDESRIAALCLSVCIHMHLYLWFTYNSLRCYRVIIYEPYRAWSPADTYLYYKFTKTACVSVYVPAVCRCVGVNYDDGSRGHLELSTRMRACTY